MKRMISPKLSEMETAKSAKAKKQKGKCLAVLITAHCLDKKKTMVNIRYMKTCGTRSTWFGSEEPARAFKKISFNTKYITEKKANKVWGKSLHNLKSLLKRQTSTSLEFTCIESNRGIECLHYCWQHHHHPAILKFAGTMCRNPLNMGEVKDNLAMDLSHP